MLRSWMLALAVTAAPVAARAQQVLDLPAPNHTIEFRANHVAGFDIHGQARGAPALDYSAGVSVTTLDDGPVLHRLFLDRTHRTFFGYDLRVVPTPEGTRVRLHFAPLSDIRGFQFDKAGFRQADIPIPPDAMVAPGDPADIPLLTGLNGAVTLHETLTVTPAR